MEARKRGSLEGDAALAETRHARFALPDDPDLDTFASGVAEVDVYVQSRQWFNAGKGVAAPPTYQFLTEPDGEVVGLRGAVAFRNYDHPHDGAATGARYSMVYVTGLHSRFFQGQRNPRAPGRDLRGVDVQGHRGPCPKQARAAWA